MIRAILFDLDGTLLDRRQSLEQFICEQYNRFSSHLMSIEEIRVLFSIS
ncbi:MULTISPECIES: HAD hydrolase-like protein [Bacillus cereus group]|uniref:HAD family hydrolase n=1 Tax=Bacillus cereus TaxID=1396 RepID=A0AAW5L861_BACCE|nr:MULTISPECIES: HAD hydrolase-like protein [Bacillus cereus group]MCQ6288614.1 HAD family hydrolase [Bacillus cereus]MCQ6302320.1 HAD family hydrolase [Bacillus cereus]MCQ6314619.1 HAD family hydrolase [Bacillus cereus]MCQ6328729.1 HAD family hydrolase [Bacillus cereus]MCQ6341756.1 HAD family hydrolase [Bacillus cereus]